MSIRRVFRDYTILLVTNRLTLGIYQDLLKPLGFGRIESTSDDRKALAVAKKLNPQLVVASQNLGIFTGTQLLSSARGDKATEKTPFLILGNKEDLKGGLDKKIKNFPHAAFIAMPAPEDQFKQMVLGLLEPLIDPEREAAYELFDRAEELAAKGDLAGAVEAYRSGLDKHPEHAESWVHMAGHMVSLEMWDDAELAYFKALKYNNYSLTAYFGLAEMYELREEYDQTIGLLKQALGVARMLKASSASVSRINFFIGEFELRLKRLTGAEKSFSEAIEDAPDDADLRTDIGDAYAEKGYYAESEKYYQGALAIDPNLAHVFNRLGIAYRRQEKYEKALQLYEQARRHHPDDEHLLFNIARAHYEKSELRNAEILLEEALLMSPQFKAAGSLIARLRSDTTQDVAKAGFNPDAPARVIELAYDDSGERDG